MKKSWQIVSIVVAVVALVFTIWQTLLSRKSTRHDLGGSLSALVDDRQVSIGESADVVVFTTDGSVDLNQVSLVPTFTNVSQYTVRDILAEYTFSGSVGFVTSDFYSSLSQGGKTILQRNERMLYAHKQTEQPFVSMNIASSEGHATIESSVTYDGAMMPFQYTTNLLVMKVEKRSSQTVEQWKQKCREVAQRRLDGRKADLYFCSSAYVSKEKDVFLSQQVAQMPSSNSTRSHPVIQNNSVAKTVAKSEPAKPTDKPVEPVAVRNTANGATEERCGLLVSSEYDATTHQIKAKYKTLDHKRNLLVWIKEVWEKDDYCYYNYYNFTSNAGQNTWTCFVETKKNGEYAPKVEVIDVMEEDTLLRKGIVVKDDKVKNHTRSGVICKVTLTDGSISYITSRGKWFRFNKYYFGKTVSDVNVFPVAKENRKQLSGDTWLWLLWALIFLIVPVAGWYYLIKNNFEFKDAVWEFKREWDLFSSFWAGFHIVIALPMLIAFVVLFMMMVV